MISLVQVEAGNPFVEDLLNNVHKQEIVIHKKYAPWIPFKTSVRDSLKHPWTRAAVKEDGTVLALCGVTLSQGYNVMWCIPRKGMAFYDRVAMMRKARDFVRNMYEIHGVLYAPVHKREWPEVKELVLFLGFSILGDDIAVYGDEEDDY